MKFILVVKKGDCELRIEDEILNKAHMEEAITIFARMLETYE